MGSGRQFCISVIWRGAAVQFRNDEEPSRMTLPASNSS
jgi:hypothetical protein